MNMDKAFMEEQEKRAKEQLQHIHELIMNSNSHEVILKLVEAEDIIYTLIRQTSY